ncbi:hypothetical protein ACLOJK_006591 [Asimina triloba]
MTRLSPALESTLHYGQMVLLRSICWAAGICRRVLTVIRSRRIWGRCRYHCLDGVEAVYDDRRRQIWNQHVFVVVLEGLDPPIGPPPENPSPVAMDDDGGAPY